MSLRIIGGNLKRKKLFTPKGMVTRPTSDRVKEALFNILGPHITNASVLDLFAGSGALGLEALSRGAKEALFIDNDHAALTIIDRNIASCRLNTNAVSMRCNILQDLRCIQTAGRHFNLVFMDPPYARDMIVKTLHKLDTIDILKKNAMIVIEHSSGESVPKALARFSLIDQRKYGKTMLSFMRYRTSD